MNLTRVQSVRGIVQGLPVLLDSRAPGQRVIEDNMIRATITHLDEAEKRRISLMDIERKYRDTLDGSEDQQHDFVKDAIGQHTEGTLAVAGAQRLLQELSIRFMLHSPTVQAYLKRMANELSGELDNFNQQMAVIRLLSAKRD